jgi:hypothetical protein
VLFSALILGILGGLILDGRCATVVVCQPYRRGRCAQPVADRHLFDNANPQDRTSRAISALRILDASLRVCPEFMSGHCGNGRFLLSEFDEGGGLKNRCR